MNLLPFLRPGEVREMAIEIGVLEGPEEIAEFADLVDKLAEE